MELISPKTIRIGLAAGMVVLGGLLLGWGFGIPFGTLLIVGFNLLCPLMMLYMQATRSLVVNVPPKSNLTGTQAVAPIRAECRR